MKPRTQLQKEVVRASKRLAPLSDTQRQEIAEGMPHIAKLTKGQYICLACSHSWQPTDINTESVVCPHCGTTLEVDKTRKKNFRFNDYAMTVTRCGRFQVLRMWFVTLTLREEMPRSLWCGEAFQRWITPEGKTEIVGRRRQMFGGYYADSWCWDSDMELRREHLAHTISTSLIVGRMNVIPELKRNGFKGDFMGCNPHILFPNLLSDNRFETLLKCGQYDLLRHFCKSDYYLNKHWSSVKIALRHRYRIEDASMWIDLVDLLGYCGQDIRNPRLVCPANLVVAHDSWRAVRDRQLRREAEQRERERQRQATERYLANREQALTDEANYQASKSRFFDIDITDGTIHITPLKSVQEFIEEGNQQHHCVFECGYYKRPQSLILHAVIDGEPIETLEVDLTSLAVVQCRSKFNGKSAFHDRIMELMTSNLHEVARRIHKQTEPIAITA
ncbi:MAG: PcfJ domain-containing protein [Bacteroidales bacterium]|nr:PcfJ domain-containing protein [Bacteroidales bacterium]